MFMQLMINPQFKDNLESFVGLGSVINVKYISGVFRVLIYSG